MSEPHKLPLARPVSNPPFEAPPAVRWLPPRRGSCRETEAARAVPHAGADIIGTGREGEDLIHHRGNFIRASKT